MKPKKPSKKLIKTGATALVRKFNHYILPTFRPWELRHELGQLVRLAVLRNGPLEHYEHHTWPYNRDAIRDSLEACGVAHQTAQRVGNIALTIANNREHYRDGYSIRLGRYIHGRYPTGTPVELIRKLTLEFIADPLSNYAKIPYCSLKRASANRTDSTTYDFAIFASPAYGIKDYNRVEVRLDTPLARQAFATALKLAEKVYNRAKLKQPA
jgi:hypothetical protein